MTFVSPGYTPIHKDGSLIEHLQDVIIGSESVINPCLHPHTDEIFIDLKTYAYFIDQKFNESIDQILEYVKNRKKNIPEEHYDKLTLYRLLKNNMYIKSLLYGYIFVVRRNPTKLEQIEMYIYYNVVRQSLSRLFVLLQKDGLLGKNMIKDIDLLVTKFMNQYN